MPLKPWRTDDTVITADAGYPKALKALNEQGLEAYIPDNGYCKRDERHAGQARHKAKPDLLWDKSS